MGEVGTKLICENERVKVWEFILALGEALDSRAHEHDYFFSPLAGGTLEVPRGPRTDPPALQSRRVSSRAEDDTHGARNVGLTRSHEVPVELE